MPPEYSVAARQALATMAAGLLFLVILPLGIPLALIVAPFLAGRAGAQQLPRNWHAFFVLTVGFGWAVALLLALLLGLSRLAGPVSAQSEGQGSKDPEEFARIFQWRIAALAG